MMISRWCFALTLGLAGAGPLSAQPRKFALLVGVNNYDGTGFTSLSHTARDMETLAKHLRAAGFEPTVLVNRQATKVAIESELRELRRKRGPNDLVLLALSGHGVQTRNDKGEEDAFFCPAGCNNAEIESMISLSGLLPSLGREGVNLLLIDACRDDPRKGIQGNELKDRLPANTSILFSCAAGQSSYETTRMFGAGSTQGHGVFFYHVLEALSGKAARDAAGDVTWLALVDYVTKNVNTRAKSWFPDRAQQRAKELGVSLADLKFQTPHLLGNVVDPPVLIRRGALVPIAPIAKGTLTEFAGLKAHAPSIWKLQPGSGGMLYHFVLPRGNDKYDTEVVLTDERGGKSVIDYWKRLVEPPTGKAIDEMASIEQIKVGALRATMLDVRGDLKLPKSVVGRTSTFDLRVDQRVIVVALEGSGIVRFIGPARTVAANHKNFKEWLENLR